MKDLAEKRATQLREHSSYKDAGVYDPDGVNGTHVIYVLHDAKNPEKYGGLPSNPRIPIWFSSGRGRQNGWAGWQWRSV